jgi:hypothetical protein
MAKQQDGQRKMFAASNTTQNIFPHRVARIEPIKKKG